jgi:hypothetical protein
MTGQKGKREFMGPRGVTFSGVELRYSATARKVCGKGASR